MYISILWHISRTRSTIRSTAHGTKRFHRSFLKDIHFFGMSLFMYRNVFWHISRTRSTIPSRMPDVERVQSGLFGWVLVSFEVYWSLFGIYLSTDVNILSYFSNKIIDNAGCSESLKVSFDGCRSLLINWGLFWYFLVSFGKCRSLLTYFSNKVNDCDNARCSESL